MPSESESDQLCLNSQSLQMSDVFTEESVSVLPQSQMDRVCVNYQSLLETGKRHLFFKPSMNNLNQQQPND